MRGPFFIYSFIPSLFLGSVDPTDASASVNYTLPSSSDLKKQTNCETYFMSNVLNSMSYIQLSLSYMSYAYLFYVLYICSYFIVIFFLFFCTMTNRLLVLIQIMCYYTTADVLLTLHSNQQSPVLLQRKHNLLDAMFNILTLVVNKQPTSLKRNTVG